MRRLDTNGTPLKVEHQHSERRWFSSWLNKENVYHYFHYTDLLLLLLFVVVVFSSTWLLLSSENQRGTKTFAPLISLSVARGAHWRRVTAKVKAAPSAR